MSVLALAPAAAAAAPPAGGAAVGEIVIGSAVAALLGAGLAIFGIAHRRGKTQVLTRLGAFAERSTGLPPWAALPIAIAGGSLLIAVFGFYWDVATHIDSGRDPGPFTNVSHYFIIFGLLGIAFAGYVAILLGSGDDTPSGVTVGAAIMGEGWRVPVGGLLLLACGGIAVLGFPLDDLWHRLFGQDVTLWSPTHLQMVGGASLSTLGLWVLLGEARPKMQLKPYMQKIQGPALSGAFLIGLSTMQAEFDYSVPQFQLLYHPILLMMSAAAALVPARISLGRGGALKAVAFFLGLRAILTLIIGPVMGHTLLHFPLYIVEALAVEAVAMRVSTKRQLSFGLWCGVAIGTFGLAAEWLWSHIWMNIPWPASLLPEGIIFGVLAALSGGLLGGYIGRALTVRGATMQWGSRWLAAATAVGIVFCLAYPFPTVGNLDATADITLTDQPGMPGYVQADIQVSPPTAIDEPSWFNVTAWQGGGSVIDALEPLGDGRYRTTQPIPITGEWKTLVRLQQGRTTMALPIYLPADPAIPADAVPASPHFEREFIADKEVILREAKDVGVGLIYGGGITLGLIFLGWVLIIAWGMNRLQPGPLLRQSPPIPQSA